MSKIGRYGSVKIPGDLADQVDEFVTTGKYGFKSRAEFVKEAVRDKLFKYRLEGRQT